MSHDRIYIKEENFPSGEHQRKNLKAEGSSVTALKRGRAGKEREGKRRGTGGGKGERREERADRRKERGEEKEESREERRERKRVRGEGREERKKR